MPLRPLLISSLLAAALLCWDVAGLGAEEEYDRSHWSLAASRQPQPPALASRPDRDWLRNEIDAFVLARLKRRSCGPPPKPTGGR